jgi:hypothetical protein
VSAESSLAPILGFEALIAVVILTRSIRNYRGRSLSVALLVSFPVLTVLLWLAAEAETLYSIPWTYPWWTLLDGGFVVLGAAVTIPFAHRLVQVYQSPDGGWMYRYHLGLIAFYLASWVVRLGLAAYFDPASLEFTTSTGPPLSALASEVMQVVELLFSLSTGLVVGRSIATYRLYQKALATSPLAPPPHA